MRRFMPMRSSLLAIGLALLTCASCASRGDAFASSALGTSVALPGSLVDTGGVQHDLAADQAAGKDIALVFWQPWCGACKEEAKNVVAARARDGGKSLTIIGIVGGPASAVDEDEVERSRIQWGLNYPVVRDTDLALSESFGVESVPRVVIVSPDGTIAYDADVPPASWH